MSPVNIPVLRANAFELTMKCEDQRISIHLHKFLNLYGDFNK